MAQNSPTLSSTARPLIEASVPVLREHGLAITRRFYSRLFEEQPALRNLFNQGNQANGAQQGSLAAAVLAYAANIDKPDALQPVLERIAHKHASVGIEAAQYPLVGRHLLGAIGDVLGSAATPELLQAWAEAYGLLADQLIAAEANLYRKARTAPGEFRELVVSDVRRESDCATSYYLTTEHGASPGPFSPGQYVSVSVVLPDTGLRQLRQYSLSDAPGRAHWRLTIKRESGSQHTPAGQVSNFIHDHVQVGHKLLISPAFGNFTPMVSDERPLALLSAGVGITPMVSALNALVDAQHERPVLFAHAANSYSERPLFVEVERAASALRDLHVYSFLEDGHVPAAATQGGAPLASAPRPGRMLLTSELIAPFREANFYLCGPLPFMREQWRALTALGISPQRIQREVFGPELLDHLD